MILKLDRRTRNYVIFKEDTDLAYILYMPWIEWKDLGKPLEVEVEPTVVQEREDLVD